MSQTDPDFYHQLERRGLTSSQRDFSSYYLNMAPNYFCLRGKRGLSERALVNLFRRLWDERRPMLAWRVAHQLLFGSAS